MQFTVACFDIYILHNSLCQSTCKLIKPKCNITILHVLPIDIVLLNVHVNTIILHVDMNKCKSPVNIYAACQHNYAACAY